MKTHSLCGVESLTDEKLASLKSEAFNSSCLISAGAILSGIVVQLVGHVCFGLQVLVVRCDMLHTP